MKVKGIDLHLYMEVFEILEWKDGCIYKTKTTGKFIHASLVAGLDLKKFKPVSVSTRMYPCPDAVDVELPMFLDEVTA